MLGKNIDPSFDQLMKNHPLNLVVPPKIHLELQKRGAISTCDEDVRIAPRFRCSGPAILEWVESPRSLQLQFPTTQAIVRNLSKTGFSILADRQWFPEQIARLYLPIAIVKAKVVRARRLGSNCYDIGLRIVHYQQVKYSHQ